jgi:GNAT superfamily N-acetyltransferase
VVTGCSRLGKAAFVAAARDERFTVCVPNQTGGGGVPLAKRNYGENISIENRSFTHWYCRAYAKYAKEPWNTMPFDQHLFAACIAPRALLVEGFDEFNMSITFYNHPYYIKHMEKLGLVKEVDWVEYMLTVPAQVDPKLVKMSEYLQKRNGYQLVTYTDRKVLSDDAFEAFKVIDEAFSSLYGTVPLTDTVINKALADYIPIVNLKYICSVKDKDGSIVGFAVLVPSIAKALKKSNGRLLPFGLFRLLKALKCKNDTLEMYFIAVRPELQKKGIPAIIMTAMLQACIDNGVKYCETGPELELNENVQSLWKGLDVRQHKRRRCWKKDI